MGILTRKNRVICFRFFNLNDVIANTIAAMLADVMNHYGYKNTNCFFGRSMGQTYYFLQKKRLQSKMLETTYGISPIFFHIYAALLISKNLAFNFD